MIELDALLTVALVSFLGANALILCFGGVLVGIGRYEEARTRNASGIPYAALAVIAGIGCLALLVTGFYAVIGH